MLIIIKKDTTSEPVSKTCFTNQIIIRCFPLFMNILNIVYINKAYFLELQRNKAIKSVSFPPAKDETQQLV